ncbi:porin [Undibacterium sp. TJN25]|uniref:porin n=1 Tax=Undibacterium sp. TJN25 TaxID=3413056 RepID=UPI003BF384EB
MKKSNLALAVLSACGLMSGSAFAQSNVTIYGLLDAGLAIERGGAAGNVVKLSSGMGNGSRLGFKGTEDLGDGMSAYFTMEMGMAVDTGASTQGGLAFGRQIFVGVKGSAGQIQMGRQYNPIDDTLGQVDPFGNGFAGRTASLFGNGPKNTGGYTARLNNVLQYITPNLSGFTGYASYGFGEVAGDNSAGRYIGLSAAYVNGPFWTRLAYSKLNGTPATSSVKNTVLAATYDFGVVKAAAAYGVNKDEAGGATTLDSADAMLGITVPLGQGSFLANVTWKNDKTAADNGAKMYAIGYQYDFSKRTRFYIDYGHVSNDHTLLYAVNYSVDTGTGTNAVTVGMQHRF